MDVVDYLTSVWAIVDDHIGCWGVERVLNWLDKQQLEQMIQKEEELFDQVKQAL